MRFHLHLARFIALLAVHRRASSLRDVEQEEGSTRARVYLHSTDDRRGRKNASLKRTRFFRDSFSKDYDRLSLSLARARFKDRGDY